jgi:hypothetical protein
VKLNKKKRLKAMGFLGGGVKPLQLKYHYCGVRIYLNAISPISQAFLNYLINI